jgi:hypothetical protein
MISPIILTIEPHRPNDTCVRIECKCLALMRLRRVRVDGWGETQFDGKRVGTIWLKRCAITHH